MQLCAIPASAEGYWGVVKPTNMVGDVKIGDVKRQYIVGGNWKSNGNKEFVSTFPKDVLAKA